MAQSNAGGPEPLGDPPPDLDQRSIPIVPYPGMVSRAHWLDNVPLYFGKDKKWRFDDPLGKYGIMYASATPEGAFAETLLPHPGAFEPMGAGSVPVSATNIEAHGLAQITFTEPLQCIDLCGEHVAVMGADASIATGPWNVSQRWSRALFTLPSQPEALLYRSRRDPSQISLAIHERARPKATASPLGGLAEPQHAGLLAAVVRRYHVVIIPSHAAP
jgi:hypothetical protein